MNRERFRDKVVIVTGGGQSIGRATCEVFAAEGAAVVVAERNPETCQQTAETIRAAGGRALAVVTDVSQEPSVREMVAAAVGEFGRVDVLVNNAAVFVLRGIEATAEEWREILDVNVIGPSLCAKYAVPEMRKVGGGAIVNLGSISSFVAQPGFMTYNASKGAIAQMTRCMALDLAADNIRVNAVCPGTVWSPIVEKLAGEKGLDRRATEAHPEYGGSHMIQRMVEPEEIAKAILFMASDDAAFITAEHLMVDGGYIAK